MQVQEEEDLQAVGSMLVVEVVGSPLRVVGRPFRMIQIPILIPAQVVTLSADLSSWCMVCLFQHLGLVRGRPSVLVFRKSFPSDLFGGAPVVEDDDPVRHDERRRVLVEVVLTLEERVARALRQEVPRPYERDETQHPKPFAYGVKSHFFLV